MHDLWADAEAEVEADAEAEAEAELKEEEETFLWPLIEQSARLLALPLTNWASL